MRSITILFVAAFILPIALNAQKKVTAESIIKSINNHQAVVISDAQITGDLDFTRLDNMKQEKQNSPGKIYISTVTVPVNFKNCTFTGKVLGYFNPDYNRPLKKSSTVYNANFTAAVNFEDCSFDEEVILNTLFLVRRYHLREVSLAMKAFLNMQNLKKAQTLKTQHLKVMPFLNMLNFRRHQILAMQYLKAAPILSMQNS